MQLAVTRGRFSGAWRRIRGANQLLVAGWVVLVVVLAALFVARERGELTHLVHLVRRADTRWLLAAVAMELGIVALIAEKYRLLLRRLGHTIGLGRLVEATLQKQMLATVMPVGAPSMAVFARDLSRRGVPVGDGLFATVLFSVLGNASFVLFLAPVLGWLAIEREATGLVLLAAALLLVLVLGMAAAL